MSSERAGDFFSFVGMGGATVFVTGYLALLVIAIGSKRGRASLLRSLRAINSNISRIVLSLIGLSDPVNAKISIDNDDKIDELSLSIERLQSKINVASSAIEPKVLSEEVQSKIVDLLKENLGHSLQSMSQYAIESLIRSEAHEFARSRAVDVLLETAGQLRSASSTVTVRGFINLLIGIIFAATALYFLKESIEQIGVNQVTQMSVQQVVYFVSVRASLAIIMTLVAYFFLALYKKSLEDVKYYQNEVTFISGKVAALSLVLSTGNRETIDLAIPFLMDTDRNKVANNSSIDQAVSEEIIKKIIDKLPSINFGK